MKKLEYLPLSVHYLKLKGYKHPTLNRKKFENRLEAKFKIPRLQTPSQWTTLKELPAQIHHNIYDVKPEVCHSWEDEGNGVYLVLNVNPVCTPWTWDMIYDWPTFLKFPHNRIGLLHTKPVASKIGSV